MNECVNYAETWTHTNAERLSDERKERCLEVHGALVVDWHVHSYQLLLDTTDNHTLQSSEILI